VTYHAYYIVNNNIDNLIYSSYGVLIASSSAPREGIGLALSAPSY